MREETAKEPSIVASLRDEANRFWQAILDHPMVDQLGRGTLDEEPFRYWVKQDYVYLIEYSRVFGLASARGPNLEMMGQFAELLDETLNTEMDLHRSYAREFGISESELENTQPSPTTRAYTDFLVRTAALEPFGAVVGALLPCMWGFNETALRLDDRGRPDHELYDRWIQMYAGEEFSRLAAWCRDLMNEVADGQPPDRLHQIRQAFRTSARYEYRFWDAAWRQEEWEL